MDTASAPPPGSPVAEEFALLIAALTAVPDFRKRKGRRHPLPGVLGLVVLGLMANCRSLSAISRYAQIHPDVLPPLGLPRPPSVPTLSRVLAGIDPAAVRAALLGFTQALLQRRGHTPCVAAIDMARACAGSTRARARLTSCTSLPMTPRWCSIRCWCPRSGTRWRLPSSGSAPSPPSSPASRC